MILTVVTQINFLVCRVNDIIDLKMIEDGQFSVNSTKFNPMQTLKAVNQLFMSSVQHKMTRLNFKLIPFNVDPFSDIFF